MIQMYLTFLRESQAGLMCGLFCSMILLSHVHHLVDGQITNVFAERSSGGQLRNFVFDSHTNSLYVGSINSLYWLSGELGMLNSLELGPMNDHPNCSIDLQEDCSYKRVPKPAIIQTLTIDADNRVLIVCSTLYHGSCRTVDMRTFVPLKYLYKPIVSNDPKGSTVMFIGPGIESGGVLYVATSYSNIGLPEYRNTTALISVRNIFSLDLSWKSSTASSVVSVLPTFRQNFPVDFVGGFHHRNYVYFFVNQPDSFVLVHEKSPFIMRICIDDSKLRSFIEIPVECKIGGVLYKRLQDVTFAPLGKRLADGLRVASDAVFGVFTHESGSATKESAVCVYSMDSIEQKFQETIQTCYNGGAYTGPGFLTKAKVCSVKKLQIPRNFCTEQDDNHPLAGSSPLLPILTATVRDAQALSILVKTAGNETVAFVGVHSGTVLKLKFRSAENLSPVYGSVKLKQEAQFPVKDLTFGLNNNVYALTDTAVYSFKSYDCGFANTCNKCIEDPHCGWCASSSRCSSKSVCNSTSLWLTDVCPLILGLSQSQVSIDKYRSTKFAVTVNFLPMHHRSIECRMEDRLIGGMELSKSRVIMPANVVTCEQFNRPPTILTNRTHVNLSLVILVDGVPWVTTSINVYNCGHLSTCGNCTSTIFSCKWCATRHKCMAMLDECTTLSGIPGNIEQRAQCPRVEFTSDKSATIMAAGTRKSFTVVGFNILIYQGKLKCLFNVGSQVVIARASFSSNDAVASQTLITCDPVELNYPGSQSYVSVPLSVVWENNLPLDKSDDLLVHLYKCRHLVSTCGHCLTMQVEYRCGWCNDHCSLEKDCGKGWMGRDRTCPNPQITSFGPRGGPVRGGTKLTIRGINLGTVAQDLEVTVSGQKCPILADTYIPSESVTCVTGVVGGPRSGSVIVIIKGHLMATSTTLFHYKDPTLFSVSPRRGPVSGGTLVRLNGTNVDFGSSVNITVGTKSAQVVSRNDTHLEFLTPSQVQPLNLIVKVIFDGNNEVPMKDYFIFVEDPVVTSVEPRISLVSGGNQIDIRGSSLNSVQKPLLVVYIGHENRTSPCKVTSPSFLQCITPDLRDADEEIDRERQLEFGLIMDNVRQLLNIPNSRSAIRPFTYFPLPAIRRFLSNVRYKKGDMVLIQGKHLAALSRFRDLNVTVGGVKCDVVDDNGQHLTFVPPENPVHTKNNLALVRVQIGNFYEDVGYIDYKTFPLRLVLGLVLGLGLTLIAGIVLLVVCFSRRRKRLAIYRKTPPKLEDVDRKKPERLYGNPYIQNNPGGVESAPLTSPRSWDKNLENDDVFEEDVDIKGEAEYFNRLLNRIENPSLQEAAKEVFISRDRIELGNLLGRGHFGQVFAATLRDLEMQNPVRVAVKTVEDTGLNAKVVENFIKEGVTMKKFDHPHALSLLGISLGVKKEPMVILPFMANGDLRSYVKDKSREFTARQLLYLAQQVAEGMAYLCSLNFIHRDLAARNCMIDENNQVKVADFGLSHELYDREYYSSNDRKAKLPIKWMALESLEDFLFTSKSDVWSFGVLMWELMTRGVTPYPDVEIFETRNYLASGRRLRKPKYCPDNIYNIMLECWNKIPERRPTFTELVNQIEILLNPSQPQKQLSGNSSDAEDPNYVNVADQEDENDYLKPTSLA